MRRYFGFGVVDLFAEFDREPVASGSIGQIHRAALSATGARLTGMTPGAAPTAGWPAALGGVRGEGSTLSIPWRTHSTGCPHCRVRQSFNLRCPPPAPGLVVAVKVRHPGVSRAIERDFALMSAAAALLGALPALRPLRLEESLKQFAAPLREQVRTGCRAVLWLCCAGLGV